MKTVIIGALTLAFGATCGATQSLDDLNIQIHGYATQGFLYTTQNNILTTNSSSGSPAWSEAVVNLSAQPNPKLRVAVQARYFLLGNYGNEVTLDFASADYKVNDKFGVRFGKVKTPSGLFNEIQDIDPGYIWSLLPQSIYPISSRNSNLAHYGGVVYGTLKLGAKLGKLEYRGWGGERVIDADDGYFLSSREMGADAFNGMSFAIYGASLHWKTPLDGLMIGASNIRGLEFVAPIHYKIAGLGTFDGTFTNQASNQPNYFIQYVKGRVMVAGETARQPLLGAVLVPGVFGVPYREDYRRWYAMASYRLTDKFTAGLYHTEFVDHQLALGPARYSKDWAVSGRYDFNQFLYAKAEQHFVDGTALSYDITLNPNGLKPTTKFTILKIGVSF